MTTDTLAMLFPNVAVTRGIAVRVAVSFLAEQSDPAAEPLVLVLSRADRERLGASRSSCCRGSWHIVDGRGTVHEVQSAKAWSAKCR